MLSMLGISSIAAQIGTVAAVVAILGAGVLFMLWRSKRNAKKQGRLEERAVQQEVTINAVEDAKRLEEAARTGSDAEWLEGVQKRHRRKD